MVPNLLVCVHIRHIEQAKELEQDGDRANAQEAEDDQEGIAQMS